ncbi:acyl-homoserine-lactone synthase [Vibrio profundum]|uniref:acyl-homoserine-lactone synthase n=1 Tax=Vibrio profundum TaxID=2910247 RepID=UPI003D0F1569
MFNLPKTSDSLCNEFIHTDCKEELFTLLDQYVQKHGASIFTTVLNARRKQIIQSAPHYESCNLATIFSHENYRELAKQPISHAPEIYSVIESLSLKYSPHWLEFWCEFSIYSLKEKYKTPTHCSPMKLTVDNDHAYQSEIVGHIENDKRLFSTLHHTSAMTLSDAISLINLDVFVRQKQWYEMLICMELSQSGEHFILSTCTEDSEYPILVSSALIQSWEKRHNWLSYQSFFQNSQWKLNLSNDGLDILNNSELFSPPLNMKYKSVLHFEQDFQKKLNNTSHLCEVLRLTVSGSIRQRVYFLYLAQKRLMAELVQMGYKFSLTIIEQPLMLRFYSRLQTKGYFNTSYQYINGASQATHKGVWNTSCLSKEFESIRFSQYKSLVSLSKNIEQQETVHV